MLSCQSSLNLRLVNPLGIGQLKLSEKRFALELINSFCVWNKNGKKLFRMMIIFRQKLPNVVGGRITTTTTVSSHTFTHSVYMFIDRLLITFSRRTRGTKLRRGWRALLPDGQIVWSFTIMTTGNVTCTTVNETCITVLTPVQLSMRLVQLS